ncbi:MAG: hypothetical protein ACF8XB_07660, partial [Planctomycetota bacterium JB042]
VPAGTPMVVVDRRGSHLGVLLPSGYNAFVHGRYVEVDAFGVGRVTTSRVNVRSVPSSREDYPIGQLDAGTELWVWGGAEGNEQWLEVTAPTDLPLWVEAGDVADAGALDDPAILERLAAALAERRRAFDERSAEAAAAAAARREAEAARAARLARIAELRGAIEEERSRGVEADYASLREEIGRLEESTAADAADPGSAAEALASAMGRIELYELERDRELENRALLARIEEEKRRLAEERQALLTALERVDTTPEVRVGTDGTWSGFVRVRPFPGDAAIKAYALESGTEVAAWLTSPDGRYRLRDFVGRSMRARGRIVAQEGARPVVEVTRLEQLR